MRRLLKSSSVHCSNAGIVVTIGREIPESWHYETSPRGVPPLTRPIIATSANPQHIRGGSPAREPDETVLATFWAALAKICPSKKLPTTARSAIFFPSSVFLTSLG